MFQRILITASLTLTSLNGCVIPIPLPQTVSLSTISSDCTEVNGRSAAIQSAYRDMLRECANDTRSTNHACISARKLSALNRPYVQASDTCVANGETGGFPDRSQYSADREEIASLSRRIGKELNW
jgi:hypothetical protein